MPSPSSILTVGLGAWGSPSDLLLLGFGVGEPPEAPEGLCCDLIIQPFLDADLSARPFVDGDLGIEPFLDGDLQTGGCC